jgi:hypothetical protein
MNAQSKTDRRSFIAGMGASLVLASMPSRDGYAFPADAASADGIQLMSRGNRGAVSRPMARWRWCARQLSRRMRTTRSPGFSGFSLRASKS